jgi:L-aspartate oxidase
VSQPPVIVVGAGVAGLTTAIALAPTPVRLVLRGRLGADGATPLAQGGLAAAVGHGDTPIEHAKDTWDAGAERNAPEAVAWMTRHAPAAVAWLEARGMRFDRDGADFRLGREGGHRRSRILHGNGDACGAAMAQALARTARGLDHIVVCEQTELVGLRIVDGRVCGARLRDGRQRVVDQEAAAVVLATGGVGALFEYRTGPDECDGTGLALALAAGARARDLEFVQYHPTALAPAPGQPGGRLPLITEALRGSGAVLRDRHGARLMAGRHPLADLAPRDVVARAVWASPGTTLDARGLGIDWLRSYPTVHALLAARGLDPECDLLPVVPALHFHMGGIAVDLDGRTSLPGLLAVGEAACNGVHGANRLASNSLLEGVVFGQRLAEAWRRREGPGRPGAKGSRLVEAAPASSPTQLARIRGLLSGVLGPQRRRSDLEAARRTLADETHRAARLGCRLIGAALANPRSEGAHWWDAVDAAPVAVALRNATRSGLN